MPWSGGQIEVTLSSDEFTSFCPVTNQPDFARITLAYVPGRAIVETKSYKLYLWSYRNERSFNESLVARIADDFAQQVNPVKVVVKGEFHPRGGVSVTATATRHRIMP